MVATLALVSGVLSCCNHTEHRHQVRRAALHDVALHDLAAKYRAIQDWDKPLTNRTGVFTIDVQDALLNKSAPLEFTGYLVDIRRDGGDIVADFTVSTAASFSLSLRLNCTEYQRKLLTGELASYAIIANIQKVAKQGDLEIASATRDENGDFDAPTFEINWDADTYWVIRICVALKKVDE